MLDAEDMALLRRYARENSDEAFAELVRRHVNMVYSVACRRVGNAHDAQDVTQVVFTILLKAARLHERTALTGWLYETTRFASSKFLRTKIRREAREQEACMQSSFNDSEPEQVWQQLAPHLEEAMANLGEKDRALVAMRFFEYKSGAQAAAALGMQEWAAHKRAARAVEKLRLFFARRGINVSAGMLIGAVSAHSVQAAPAGLGASVATVAALKGMGAGAATSTLISGTLKLMTWKLKTAALAGVGILLASGTVIVAVKTMRPASPRTDFTPSQTAAVAPVTKPDSLAGEIWDKYAQLFAQMNAQGLRGNDPTIHYAMVQLMASHPPTASIRLSQAGQPRPQPGRRGINGMGLNPGHVGIGVPLWNVLAYIYGDSQLQQITPNHIIVPDDLSPAYYDYIDTLPQGGREILRQAVKDQYGLVARREMRSNLVLTVKNPGAPGIRKHTGNESAGTNGLTAVNMTMVELTDRLGGLLGVNVADQTGLAGDVDFNLTLPKNAESDTIKAAVLDQLGMELTPAMDNQAVEVLIAEKVSN